MIYTTIISIENPRRELLPGMTANLRIETDRRADVVRIPNAALRWRPTTIVKAIRRRRRVRQRNRCATRPSECRRPQCRRAGRSGESRDQAVRPADQGDRRGVRRHAQAIRRGAAAVTPIRRRRRERGRAARQDLEQRIAATLTSEQRPQLDEIKKRIAETGGVRTQVGRVFVAGPRRQAAGQSPSASARPTAASPKSCPGSMPAARSSSAADRAPTPPRPAGRVSASDGHSWR